MGRRHLLTALVAASVVLTGCPSDAARDSNIPEDIHDEPSEEEFAASDAAILQGQDLTIVGSAPAGVVSGRVFGIEISVSVFNSTDTVQVELTLPDGVSVVGGDCPAGSGIVVCEAADVLYAAEPAVLAIDLVINPDSALGSGGSAEITAVATDWLSGGAGLNEQNEFNPEDNTLTLTTTVAAG